MKKSPAFQFYPNDWLSSPTTQIMTAEQEGAYIRLLCFCWQDDDISLKDDDDYLSALARISKGGLTVVKAAFNQHPTKQGYLTHNRLLLEYEKQKAWRDKSSQGGKKSVESKKKFKGGSRVVQPKVNQDPTLLSSSSSSSSSSINSVTNVTLVAADANDHCPYQKIASTWNEVCGGAGLPKFEVTAKRKTLIKSRWHSEMKRDLERWKSFCDLVISSSFHLGENDRQWKANIDWALRPDTITKLFEQKQNNSTKNWWEMETA